MVFGASAALWGSLRRWAFVGAGLGLFLCPPAEGRWAVPCVCLAKFRETVSQPRTGFAASSSRVEPRPSGVLCGDTQATVRVRGPRATRPHPRHTPLHEAGRACCGPQPTPWSHGPRVNGVTGPGFWRVPEAGRPPLCTSLHTSPASPCEVGGHGGCIPRQALPAGSEGTASPTATNGAELAGREALWNPVCTPRETPRGPWLLGEARGPGARPAAGLPPPGLLATRRGADHSGPDTIATGQAEIGVSRCLMVPAPARPRGH